MRNFNKIFKAFFLAFFCLFTANIAFAQGDASQFLLKGRVLDDKKMPMAGVSVRVVPTSKGTTTDSQGDYSLKLNSGNYKVSFSFVGFKTVTKEVDIAGNDVTLNFEFDAPSTELSEVIVSVGSRSSMRTITDSPIPIDIIGAADIKNTGQISFDKALQYRVPSFNTVNTPVNDATSLLDPYEIRNMGPSRTLVLINGKRKNSSSLTYIQTSPGRGESGADISAIPTDAIKRVEILRDGASAQYGSDAIAGVMNIILKDRYDYGSVSLNTGITHKGDGQMLGLSMNNGANFGDRGFINYTIDFQRTTLANRPGKVSAEAEADPDLGFGAPIADVKAFLALKPDAGNVNGAPENSSAKFLVNGGIPVGEGFEFYYNAAYIYKKVNSFANYRTPYWRTTDEGLLHAAGTPYLGYVPTFEGDLNDYNGTLGFRSTKGKWNTDVSFTTGGNKQLYTVNNTRNRGLGKNSPISFKPGGYSFSHNVGNIDISRKLSDRVNIAFGSEFRAETFEIVAGDTASYVKGGADSFPGIGQNNALTATRYNLGGYADLGIDITDNFLINGTARVEQYSDFGNAFVWKFSSRYKLANSKATLRSSISTGFRAPSLQQINLQLAQASFAPGGAIQTKGIVNNNSSQSRVLGVPKLKAEKSVNFTAGIGLNPTASFSATLDYYNIKVDDRIVLSSEIGPGNTPGSAGLNQVLADNGIIAVSFFVNGLNTRTEGLDFVANYRNIEIGSGRLGLNLAGNYTLQNKALEVLNPPLIDLAGKTVVDDTQLALLLSSRPEYKAILGGDYRIGNMSINLNNTLFGPTTFRQNGLDKNLKTVFETKMVTDLGASLQLMKNLNLGVNIQNLFNVMPKWKLVALNAGGEAILKDPQAVFVNTNLITFNGRYSNVTYDGSHFSQLGTTFAANLTVKF